MHRSEPKRTGENSATVFDLVDPRFHERQIDVLAPHF
jgi:hypothetical protein